jgi:hypothetical protein
MQSSADAQTPLVGGGGAVLLYKQLACDVHNMHGALHYDEADVSVALLLSRNVL